MRRWVGWTVLAVVAWGLWAIVGKVLGDSLSAGHSQALSTLGLLPVMLWLARSAKPPPGRKARGGVIYAFGAGIVTCLGNAAYYDLFNRGAKAATVIPLTALYPLVTILLAIPLLKEKLNGSQILGIILSLAAIYLFNVPGGGGLFSSSLAYVFAPIVLWGASGFMQKVSTRDLSGPTATFWFLAAFVLVGLIILLREPLPARIPSKTWLAVIALGFFLALGNAALLAAFANDGKASVIAPLAGLYPVVSVPLAILLLGEKIALREGVAIVLAIIAAAALARETEPAPPTSETNL